MLLIHFSHSLSKFSVSTNKIFSIIRSYWCYFASSSHESAQSLEKGISPHSASYLIFTALLAKQVRKVQYLSDGEWPKHVHTTMCEWSCLTTSFFWQICHFLIIKLSTQFPTCHAFTDYYCIQMPFFLSLFKVNSLPP